MSKFFALALVLSGFVSAQTQDRYRDYPVVVEDLVKQVNLAWSVAGRVETLDSYEIKRRTRGGMLSSLYGRFGIKCSTESEPVVVRLVMSKGATSTVSEEHKRNVFSGFNPASAHEAYDIIENDVVTQIKFISTISSSALNVCKDSAKVYFAISFWVSVTGNKYLIGATAITKEEFEKYK